MAIQVGGVTVITNGRVLQNVSGVAGAMGTSKTSIGTAGGSNSGGGTVSCAAGKYYAVTCSNDNQGGPISANAGSGAVCFEISGTTSPNINNLNLTQGGGRIFYAESTTTVDVTSSRGVIYVKRLD